MKAKYAMYNQKVVDRIEEERIAQKYLAAVNNRRTATSLADYLLSASQFEKLGDYRDSIIQAKECREKAEEVRIIAENQIEAEKKKQNRGESKSRGINFLLL